MADRGAGGSSPVHFIGIGGAGMSGLARLLLGAGAEVTGSDLRESETTRALEAGGARIRIGHRAGNVNGAARVVYTAAVGPENPELMEARRRGIPTVARAALLAEVMRGRLGIAVAGTHGKTTTTAMVAAIFSEAGTDPSVLIGGDWEPLGGNARAGSGPYFIAEACEAFDSFLELHPRVAVVTNIEADHLDWHGSEAGVVASFGRFLAQTDPGGCAVLNGDDERIRRVLNAVPCRTVTFGIEAPADYATAGVDWREGTLEFPVIRRGARIGRVRLGVPGRHNVMNALAALAVAGECDLPFDAAERALGAFQGVGRRFEPLGEVGSIRVIDDYAHHPTEIAATLAAARTRGPGRILAIFQPHLFSRSQILLEEFGGAFTDADLVVVTDIYAAREAPIPGIDGSAIADAIRAADPGKPVEVVSPKERIPAWMVERLQPGDLVLVMGAGDIRSVGEELVRELSARATG